MACPTRCEARFRGPDDDSCRRSCPVAQACRRSACRQLACHPEGVPLVGPWEEHWQPAAPLVAHRRCEGGLDRWNRWTRSPVEAVQLVPQEVASMEQLVRQQAARWERSVLRPVPEQPVRPELQGPEQAERLAALAPWPVPEQPVLLERLRLAEVRQDEAVPGLEVETAGHQEEHLRQLQEDGDVAAASWWRPPMPAPEQPCLLLVHHRRLDRGAGPHGRPCGGRDQRALLPLRKKRS